MSKRRANWFSAPMLGALATLSILGCAGRTTSEGPGDVSAEAFPDRVARLLCGRYGDCCRAVTEPFDDAACEARWRSAASSDVERAAEANHRFDRAAAQRCLDEVENSTRDCLDSVKGLYPSCIALVVGTLPLGATCDASDECAGQRDGVNCFTDVYGTPWTCAKGGVFVPPRGVLGAACSTTCDKANICSGPIPSGGALPTTDVACFVEDDLFCSGDGRCVQRGAAGQPCGGGYACASGSNCSYTANECVVPRPNGSPCRDGSECTHGACSGVCYTPTLVSPALCAYESTPPPT